MPKPITRDEWSRKTVREHLARYDDPERLATHLQASHGQVIAYDRTSIRFDLTALRAAHTAAHPEEKTS